MFEHEQTAVQESGIAQLSKNIKSAYIAALAVWILIYLVFSLMPRNNDFSFSNGAEITIANSFFLGYILSALVFWFFRKAYIVESLPLWLSIPVLGSALSMFIGALAIEALIVTHPMFTLWNNMGRFVFITFGTIILSIYTFPFTLLTKYFPLLKQRLKGYFQVS